MVMSWRHSVHNNADPAIRLVSHSTQFNANEVVFRFFAEVDVDGIKQNNSDMPVQWTYFLWILIHASTVFLHQPTQYYLPCSGNSQQGTCFCSLPWGAGSGLLYLSSLVYQFSAIICLTLEVLHHVALPIQFTHLSFINMTSCRYFDDSNTYFIHLLLCIYIIMVSNCFVLQ